MLSRRHPIVSFRALLCLAFLWTAISASRADVGAPIHDWTVHIGNGEYGFTSWAPRQWDIYWGSRVELAASVGVQYAAAILEMFLIGIIACPLAVLLLRIAVPHRPPNRFLQASAICAVLLILRQRRAAPKDNRCLHP